MTLDPNVGSSLKESDLLRREKVRQSYGMGTLESRNWTQTNTGEKEHGEKKLGVAEIGRREKTKTIVEGSKVQ